MTDRNVADYLVMFIAISVVGYIDEMLDEQNFDDKNEAFLCRFVSSGNYHVKSYIK